MRTELQPAIKPLILLVGLGAHAYRQSLLMELTGSFDVWLLEEGAVDWPGSLVIGATDVRSWAVEHLMDAALGAQAAAGRRIEGVLCWEESHVLSSALLAEALGLPGMGRRAAAVCRDKLLTRQVLNEAGLLQPSFRHCSSLAEAEEFARHNPFPLVIKPRSGAGSVGVAKITSPTELPIRLAAARVGTHLARAGGGEVDAVIETFMEGVEVSVDGMTEDGTYKPLYVAIKTTGLAPHFEELGHVVGAEAEQPYIEALAPMLETAHRAISFQSGMTHTEVLITENGPAIVEINGRLGGDFIPRLAYRAFGLKAGVIAGAIACGRRPDVERVRSGTAAVEFLYPHRSGVLCDLDISFAMDDQECTYGEIIPLAATGDLLKLPPEGHMNRIAALIAEGEDYESVRSRIELLRDTVVFETANISG